MFSEDYVMDKINYWQNELKKIHNAYDRGEYDNNQFIYGRYYNPTGNRMRWSTRRTRRNNGY